MSDFAALQQQWTNWLRHPQTAPQPEIDTKRLTIYRELFFNNVSSFVNSAFPLLQQQLSTEVWQQLLDDFFANHHCQSPYFYDISSEFYQYLTTQTHLLADYPWLLELAHFEWAEIAADIAEGDWPDYQQGDLLTNIPVLNPFVWPLVYQWPVHQMNKDKNNLSSLTYILMYRNLENDVQMMELNPLSLQVVQLLQENQTMTGRDLLDILAQQLQQSQLALEVPFKQLLATLLDKQIILGVI